MSRNTLIRKLALDFTVTVVVDGIFKKVNLSYQRQVHGPLFYLKDFSFMCPTEITAFSNHDEDFQKLGCKVLQVSVDYLSS